MALASRSRCGTTSDGKQPRLRQVNDASRSYRRASRWRYRLVVAGSCAVAHDPRPRLGLDQVDRRRLAVDRRGGGSAARMVDRDLDRLAAWSARSRCSTRSSSPTRVSVLMAGDRSCPRAGSQHDGATPRNAVLVSAAFYSVFVLVPFGRLVVADVLLFARAFPRVRRTDPTSANGAGLGTFRIPWVRLGRVLARAAP